MQNWNDGGGNMPNWPFSTAKPAKGKSKGKNKNHEWNFNQMGPDDGSFGGAGPSGGKKSKKGKGGKGWINKGKQDDSFMSEDILMMGMNNTFQSMPPMGFDPNWGQVKEESQAFQPFPGMIPGMPPGMPPGGIPGMPPGMTHMGPGGTVYFNMDPEQPKKKKHFRRCIDISTTVINFLERWSGLDRGQQNFGCNYTYTKDLLPAFATPYAPVDAICNRYVYSAVNKIRAAVNTVSFSPNGRRVITGSHTGELTIWNAQQFHFESNMQAHTAAIRAITWNTTEDILLSGDQLGQIKLWDQNFYNSQNLQAHKDSLREISMAPTGLKFASCADDSSAKVWDFKTLKEERVFAGHGWDVKCCHWHPSKGLVATGSKDSLIKLWDPRVEEAITTLHGHKNMVTRVRWSGEGNWLISGSRDTTIGLMDIRTMAIRKHFKGHTREVTALTWHPEYETIFVSGGFDGNLIYWDITGAADKPIDNIEQAHDSTIWSIAWHPFGHLVASGSHDNCCRFWSRARPGDGDTKGLVPKRDQRFDIVKMHDKMGMGKGGPGMKPELIKEEEETTGELPKPSCLPSLVLKTGIFAGEEPDLDEKRGMKRIGVTIDLIKEETVEKKEDNEEPEGFTMPSLIDND